MANDSRIMILAGRQTDGTTYRLDPLTQRRLSTEYPTIRQAPSVFVGFNTQSDFESLHGRMWGQIAALLTGQSLDRLFALGSVIIRDVSANREFEVKA